MNRISLLRSLPRFTTLFGFCLALAALPATPALAHAVVVESAPAVGATLDGKSVAVKLRYNSRIDHERSRLTLVGPDNQSRTLDLDKDTPPDILAADLADLPPGQYRLRWQVLAVDGHLTRGDIPFSVKAP